MKNEKHVWPLVPRRRVWFASEKHGLGTITAVHTRPGSKGGEPYSVDIVFDSGRTETGIPVKRILREARDSWKVYEHMDSDEQLLERLATASVAEADRRLADERRRRAWDEACDVLRTDASYAHLEQLPRNGDRSSSTALNNLRRDLAHRFPRTRFRVRARRQEVTILWQDGPTVNQVDALALRYEQGPNEDGYPRVFAAVFGGVRAVFSSRTYSRRLVDRAIDEVFSEFAGLLEGIDRPDAEAVLEGHTWIFDVPATGSNLHELIMAAAGRLEA